MKRLNASVLSILVSCGFLLSQPPLCAEDFAATFDAANTLYAEGKFTEAAGVYEKILETGRASPALYFNLGNAFFKSGRMGRAIAAYRQAENIAPRDPDLRANLQFARNQVQGPTLRPGRLERWLGTLSLQEWTWLSTGAVWLTFGLLILRQLRPSFRRSLKTWSFVGGGVAGLSIVCLALTFVGGSKRPAAVVTAPEAAVRSGPLDASSNVFTARDGAELRVLDLKEDWLEVTVGTRRGWTKQAYVILLPAS